MKRRPKELWRKCQVWTVFRVANAEVWWPIGVSLKLMFDLRLLFERKLQKVACFSQLSTQRQASTECKRAASSNGRKWALTQRRAAASCLHKLHTLHTLRASSPTVCLWPHAHFLAQMCSATSHCLGRPTTVYDWHPSGKEKAHRVAGSGPA